MYCDRLLRCVAWPFTDIGFPSATTALRTISKPSSVKSGHGNLLGSFKRLARVR
jgi:hypothetical protein